MLLLSVQQLKISFKNQIDSNLGKIDLVIGAKGSPLQLILASVLHLDNPTGNISYHEAEKISKSSFVKLAVPISYGDNYEKYRIIGTTKEYLSIYNAELQNGDVIKKPMEVILGNTVAKQLNFKIGDTFLSSHGLKENDIDLHADKLTVVGILKPTKKVIDRLIITNLESIWNVHKHEDEIDEDNEIHTEHHPQKTHDLNREITSLLISFKSPRALLTFPRKINKETNMQAALPKYELHKLYEYTNIGFQTISWIAYLILLISGMIIFISLYKMVKERAFDLALLRTYGASNLQLIKMVIYEGITIVFFAFIIGFIFVKTALYFIFKIVKNYYHHNILQELSFNEVLQTGGLVLIMMFLSISLATYPIIKMNISTILSNEK